MLDTADAMLRQIEMEHAARDAGRDRFLRAVTKAQERGRGDETAAGVAVLRRTLEPTAKAIQQWISDSMAGKPQHRATAAVLLDGIDPYLLAYLTLSRMFAGVSYRKAGRPLSQLASSIATSIDHELRMAAFEEQQPSLYATVMARLKDRGATEQHVERVAVYAAGKYGVEWAGWTVPQTYHIGTALVDIAMAQTGLFDLAHPLVGRNRRPAVIQPRPEMIAWMQDRDEKAALMRPVLGPMIVPPRPWKGIFGGGYRSDAILKAPIVKRLGKEHRVALEAADLGKVCNGLNAIQETPWRINTRVLDVARALWDAGAEMPGLPPKEDRPLPEQTWTEEPPPQDALKAWKRAARDVYDANIASRSMRMLTVQQLEAAEELSGEPALFFPHNLDFRGRCYARPQALNPQGNDLCRGLLTFAEGKPLDDRARRWLAIHGANCFGIDKVSHDERVAWVEQNIAAIWACADDPLGNTFWHQAEAPWSFLAYCFEQRAVICGDASSLPIAMDGTCNGLQHYSAMLRDPVGGAAVNLVRAESPQDIYGEVAKRVVEKLRGVAVDTSHERSWAAQSWADFGIDRKMTKRQVMVLPYGGTRNSCLNYTKEAVADRIAGGAENPFGAELGRECAWLAGIIWEAIGEVVIAARTAMDWLREVSKIVTSAGIPIAWTTPSGFPALQDYRTTKERMVKTRLNGKFVYLTHNEETDKLDKARQALGLPPNFVHSLDASAMVLTIGKAKDRGVTQFAMIHDSYGTVAADTQVLADCLREAFVEMYSGDILADFARQVADALPPGIAARLPSPPPLGSLDMRLVLDSPFFFT